MTSISISHSKDLPPSALPFMAQETLPAFFCPALVTTIVASSLGSPSAFISLASHPSPLARFSLPCGSGWSGTPHLVSILMRWLHLQLGVRDDASIHVKGRRIILARVCICGNAGQTLSSPQFETSKNLLGVGRISYFVLSMMKFNRQTRSIAAARHLLSWLCT